MNLSVASFAKINLGLKVLGRRPDGYHEIRSVLLAVDLADEITMEEDPALTLSVEGGPAGGPGEIPSGGTNLVLRAARALAERYPGKGARIRLTKRIPAGAGLGGGSSNAAATLTGLSRLWSVDPDPGLLHGIARDLGSDVPFFLYGGACLALGRGDDVFPLPDPPAWTAVIVWPGIHISTAEVYGALPSSLTRSRILSSMKGFLPADGKRTDTGPAAAGPAWTPLEADNDLEQIVFERFPRLRSIKERLLEAGAFAAAMSGSGSAVYGLYHSSKGTEKLAASLLAGEGAAFVCRILSRDAYRLSQFKRSRT